MVVVANTAEITAPRSDSWSQHWRLITVFAARLLAWRIPRVIIDPATSDFSEVPVSATPLLWRNLLHAKNDDIRYRPPLPTPMRSLDLQTGAALSLIWMDYLCLYLFLTQWWFRYSILLSLFLPSTTNRVPIRVFKQTQLKYITNKELNLVRLHDPCSYGVFCCSMYVCLCVCVWKRFAIPIPEEECFVRKHTPYGVVMVTNQGNKGLISADRRTKPTLVRTIPRYIVKSSTRDLSYPIFSIVISYDVAPKRILIQVTSGKVNIAAFQHGFWLRGVQP